jgi:ATP-dependent DNA helicase RecG
MDDAELDSLLADLESDRSERKQGATDMDRIGQAVCAFANDMPGHRRPGYVFIGARDDGTPSGEPITDELLLKLAAIRDSGNVLPQPRLNVQKRVLRGAEMAVIEVFPSDLPPVRYKSVVWIRVGSRRARANESEERALGERRAAMTGRTWDARPCRDATLEDLALELFAAYRTAAVDRAVLDENHRSLPEQLDSLRFFDRRAAVPTHAGVLLFGKDPRYFFSGAYVQLVWYAGETPASDPLRHGDIPREAFPGVTAYRNPVLAEAAKVLGYVNRFGRGVPRVHEAMRRNGSGSPVFEPATGHFLVSLPRRP